jgi:hypothetical protein
MKGECFRTDLTKLSHMDEQIKVGMELNFQAMAQAASTNLHDLSQIVEEWDNDVVVIQEDHNDAQRVLQTIKGKLQEAKQQRELTLGQMRKLRKQIYQPLRDAYLGTKQMDEKEWTTQVSTTGKAMPFLQDEMVVFLRNLLRQVPRNIPDRYITYCFPGMIRIRP